MVLAIVAVLMSAGMFFLAQARERMKTTTLFTQLLQLEAAMATASYHGQYPSDEVMRLDMIARSGIPKKWIRGTTILNPFMGTIVPQANEESGYYDFVLSRLPPAVCRTVVTAPLSPTLRAIHVQNSGGASGYVVGRRFTMAEADEACSGANSTISLSYW